MVDLDLDGSKNRFVAVSDHDNASSLDDGQNFGQI